MCGGFSCSKNTLIGLNVMYIIVAFVLIGVASYSKHAAILTSLPIVGGIIACGVFLLMISVVGLMGTMKHNQVMLFFYMCILFIIFVIQFSVACACLAVDEQTERTILKKAWDHSTKDVRLDFEKQLGCCAFEDQDDPEENKTCPSVPGCIKDTSATTVSAAGSRRIARQAGDGGNTTTTLAPTTPPSTTPAASTSTTTQPMIITCQACYPKIQPAITSAFNSAGGLGLFFSFTEFIGVWMTVRYRNQKNPRANPSAFL